MKKLFAFIFLFFLSGISFAESYCDLSKGQTSEQEYNACTNREKEASKLLGSIISSAGNNIVVVANYIFQDIAKSDLKISDSDDYQMTPAKQQTNIFLAILSKLIEIVSLIGNTFFLCVVAVIIFIILFRAMKDGVAIKPKDAFFISLMIGIGVISALGGLSALVKLFSLVAIILGIAVYSFLSPILITMFGYDLDAVKSKLYYESVNFADVEIEANYKAHVSDIRAKNKLIFEFSTALDSYGWILEDNELMNCFNNPVNQDVSNKKLYIPKHFIAGSECVNDELGYKVYKMFRIEDTKDNNASAAVIQKIDSMQDKIRQFAYNNIHKNNCAAVNDLDHKKISDYLGVCGNRELDGNYTANENGYIQEFKNLKVIDSAEVIKEKEALKKELAAFVYTKMLERGATVAKGSNNMSSENLVAVMNLGLSERKAFKKAALEVIDIDIVDEIVVKKNKLQEGYDILANFFTFGAEGEDETFGINEYMESISVKKDFNKEIAALMNVISGNAFDNLGLQYEDCYVKYTCNSGESNIFITINESASALVDISFIAYVGTTIRGESMKRSAEKASSYDKEKALQGSQLVGLGKFFLAPIILIFFLIAYLFRTMILSFFGQIFFSLALHILMPALLMFALSIHAWNVSIKKDDRYSFADLLSKYGVYDAGARFPLIIISLMIIISVVLIIGNISSVLLFKVIADSMNMYVAEGGMAMLFSVLVVFSIYIVCYITIQSTCILKATSYTTAKLDELLGDSASYESALNAEAGRLKGFVSKAK